MHVNKTFLKIWFNTGVFTLTFFNSSFKAQPGTNDMWSKYVVNGSLFVCFSFLANANISWCTFFSITFLFKHPFNSGLASRDNWYPNDSFQWFQKVFYNSLYNYFCKIIQILFYSCYSIWPHIWNLHSDNLIYLLI